MAATIKKLPALPAERALKVISGRWKAVILYHLFSGKKRLSELGRLVPSESESIDPTAAGDGRTWLGPSGNLSAGPTSGGVFGNRLGVKSGTGLGGALRLGTASCEGIEPIGRGGGMRD